MVSCHLVMCTSCWTACWAVYCKKCWITFSRFFSPLLSFVHVYDNISQTRFSKCSKPLLCSFPMSFSIAADWQTKCCCKCGNRQRIQNRIHAQFDLYASGQPSSSLFSRGTLQAMRFRAVRPSSATIFLTLSWLLERWKDACINEKNKFWPMRLHFSHTPKQAMEMWISAITWIKMWITVWQLL